MVRITEDQLRAGMNLGVINPVISRVSVNGFKCDARITRSASSVRIYGYNTYPEEVKRPLYRPGYRRKILPHQPLTPEDIELYSQVLGTLGIIVERI